MVLKKLKNKSYVWQAVEEVSHEEQIGSSNLKLNHENDWKNKECYTFKKVNFYHMLELALIFNF